MGVTFLVEQNACGGFQERRFGNHDEVSLLPWRVEKIAAHVLYPFFMATN